MRAVLNLRNGGYSTLVQNSDVLCGVACNGAEWCVMARNSVMCGVVQVTPGGVE